VSSDRRPYSRIYWSVLEDERFDGIRESERYMGAWTILLIAADMAYPAPAYVPPTISKPSLTALIGSGLVEQLAGGRFRIHGLEAERTRRSEAARAGGFARGRNADAVQVPSIRSADAQQAQSERAARRVLDEAETSKTPIPPPSGGHGLRSTGENPRAIAARAEAARLAEIEDRKEAVRQIRQRYYRGEITEAQLKVELDDVGKPADDLTRSRT